MQKWEYLVVQTEFPGGMSLSTAKLARFANGRELRDWKKTPLHTFITQLGEDGWEMTGIEIVTSNTDYLFFKRPKP